MRNRREDSAAGDRAAGDRAAGDRAGRHIAVGDRAMPAPGHAPMRAAAIDRDRLDRLGAGSYWPIIHDFG